MCSDVVSVRTWVMSALGEQQRVILRVLSEMVRLGKVIEGSGHARGAKGKVIEEGSHEELMAKGKEGAYFRLQHASGGIQASESTQDLQRMAAQDALAQVPSVASDPGRLASAKDGKGDAKDEAVTKAKAGDDTAKQGAGGEEGKPAASRKRSRRGKKKTPKAEAGATAEATAEAPAEAAAQAAAEPKAKRQKVKATKKPKKKAPAAVAVAVEAPESA